MDFSHVVKMANSECAASCASPSQSGSTVSHSTHSNSASASGSDESSYTSSALGDLWPPPRKKGKYLWGQEISGPVGCGQT